MDPNAMTEEQIRETASRMLEEMERVLNGEETESEYETDNEPDPSGSSSQAPAPRPATTADATEAAPPEGEKKKKKKKRGKKKNNKADLEDLLSNSEPPEAEDPYDLSKTVAERVEIAVTRFRKNRKFSNERTQIFSNYLAYGGIRTGQKSFQGGAVKSGGPDDDEGEPDFEAMNTGIDAVDLPEDGQVVDFTQVVTTYLSQHFLRNTGWVDMTYYKDTPVVVGAFLSYLLIRNVVPEHEQDVRNALAVAEKARVELPLCKLISNGLPGRFSKACSLMYGGEWYEFLDSTWQDKSQLIETMGVDLPTAEAIIQAAAGPDVDMKTLQLAPKEFLDLEIIRVELPKDLDASTDSPEETSQEEIGSEEEARIVEMVDRMLLGQDTGGPAQSAVGAPSAPAAGLLHVPVLAKVTMAEMDPELTREEQAPADRRRQVYTYFDLSIATKMLPGMRIEACVYTLSNGMSYLEQASVYPTFYMEAEEVEGEYEEGAEDLDD
ncbi:Argonaute complex, subunit Arb1 [Mortierella sp. GBAus27b]|nr:Argonaute complex, subunit Arb1 [Mortierella sp. GBAus27b]